MSRPFVTRFICKLLLFRSRSFCCVPHFVQPCFPRRAPAAVLPPLRRCCRPCGMAFPQRNNKKCPSPPFQETETLKLLPSDSCSPCAKHFLTATNLILALSFYTIRYKNATEILGPAGKICRTAMIKSEGQTTWRFSMCLSLANPLDSAFFQVP